MLILLIGNKFPVKFDNSFGWKLKGLFGRSDAFVDSIGFYYGYGYTKEQRTTADSQIIQLLTSAIEDPA